jgi:16S rRNA (cytosine967-C5)-methyltransferase
MGYNGIRGGVAPKVPAGFQARQLAVTLIASVLRDGRAFDDAIAQAHALPTYKALEPRDRALARMIAATVLRRQGQIESVIATFLEKPLPEKRGNLTPILLTAAAQLLFLEQQPHAVLNIAVDQCRHDGGARRFDKLANAVLRRVSERGRALLEPQHSRLAMAAVGCSLRRGNSPRDRQSLTDTSPTRSVREG